MYISAESHLDHNLSLRHLRFILDMCAHTIPYGDGPTKLTLDLPDGMEPVPCALYGPLVGDAPVDQKKVKYRTRGTRGWASPIVYRPCRPSRQVSVIIGWDGRQYHVPVLYTAFGGPIAPREPGDPECEDVAASEDFWLRHALSYQVL